jgi:RNA polymerase-binding transcription factor DksA
MKNYEDVRSNLISMLEELDDRLDKITNDVRHVDIPIEQNSVERSVESENDEVLDAIGNSTRDEVEKIKQAISRIDSGTYGICLICGKPIKKERLLALPYANQCLHCTQELEQK